MRTLPVRLAGLSLLAAALALSASAAPTRSDAPATGVVKDRKKFIPFRKYRALPGKTVGILVSDVVAMMGQEGRGGPANAMGFSANGDSYRWIYVPVEEKPQIRGLSVPVGEKGGKTRRYDSLSMASPTTVKQWGITASFALIEVQVNDGLGSPAGESFVATKMKRLDATRAYPLKLPEVVADLRKRYATHVKEQKKAVETALTAVQKKVLKGRKVTGPRETKELFYITWLPDSQRVRVHFRTTQSDGAYQYAERRFGRGRGGRPRGILPKPPAIVPPGGGKLAFFPPPPPPRPIKVRYGVTFGVEYGMAYEVDKNGKVVRVEELKVQSFHQEIPPPPGVRGPKL
jgi:hypothetical protein